MAQKYEDAGRPKKLDLAFTLGVNHFMGRQFLQLEMLDFKPSHIEERDNTELMDAMSDALKRLAL